PRRLEIALPWRRAGQPWLPPTWIPGAAAMRTKPPRVNRPFYAEPSISGHVTPGLARQTDLEDGEDALGATLKWLAARRGARRHIDLVGVGHRGDLERLSQAIPGHVDDHRVHRALLEERAVLAPPKQALAAGDRNRGARADVAQRLRVADIRFDPEQVERLH